MNSLRISRTGVELFLKAILRRSQPTSSRPVVVGGAKGSSGEVSAGRVPAETAAAAHWLAGREDFPAVGDWVAVRRPKKDGRGSSILPRNTKLARKAAGREMSEQIVATNSRDTVFCGERAESRVWLRRIGARRSWDSGARPVILLNKADPGSTPRAPLMWKASPWELRCIW
jgi:putative ribosome biogenesis GTPase RsgA